MKKYQLSADLLPVFKMNPWWTFMGKYFGFPDCCIKAFCSSFDRSSSLFKGTGYVPCSSCNEKIINYTVVKQYTDMINAQRLHHIPFCTHENFELNSHLFKILDNFFVQNKVFPYEEILCRGGQEYLYQKFFNQTFSFVIHLLHKNTKESMTINLPELVSVETLGMILYSLKNTGLTPFNQKHILVETDLHSHYTIDHTKTNVSIEQYNTEISILLALCYQSFQKKDTKEPMLTTINSQNNTKNILQLTKKYSPIN